ncbi:MAG: hypothetical protein BECKG1743D_GA0114223_108762 [Candidatus Kentron sp. G]|nr:MAG: hypothetical protein BECKG1743F_GA0114225_109811 [Candidatus Kentron sp. G]VFN04969.1 MAG: hypothetical protein BECKG1743E_GA0114224_108022 [Candidatus Kentron sp. G]VFN06517.1 MAG: hypothetical protein BECKG1743D_GA0114223_108762 [Candidatus Kentron sp. G]
MAELAALVRQRAVSVKLVISMREDFALEMNAFRPHLHKQVFENYYRLEKLDREGAEQAIENPVKNLGFRYEHLLVRELLRDLVLRERNRLGDSAIPLAQSRVEAPYLQIVCQQLWEIGQLDPAKVLRLADYRAHGGAGKLLENYVSGRLSRLSLPQRRLASGAFDHLVTREGTKTARTVENLATALNAKEKDLAPVLETLHEARILRYQNRTNLKTQQPEDWYELYHDLFSDSIGQWNRVFKNRERNRRAAKMAAAGIVIIAGLYCAYDTVTYFTNRHLASSLRGGPLERVELFQGKAGREPLFFHKAFIAETELLSAHIEPHLRFKEKGIDNPAQLVAETTSNRGLVDGIETHWANGNVKTALDLADRLISSGNLARSREIIRWLEKLPSRAGEDLLRCYVLRNSRDIVP